MHSSAKLFLEYRRAYTTTSGLLAERIAFVIEDAINTMDANTAVMIVSTATLNGTPLIMSTITAAASGMKTKTLRAGNLFSTHYRNNWYLECWCHTRQALRRFSLDAIESVKMLDSAAKVVSAKQLDEVFGGSYGIYGGKPKRHAVLRFSIHASRWVSNEEWHYSGPRFSDSKLRW